MIIEITPAGGPSQLGGRSSLGMQRSGGGEFVHEEAREHAAALVGDRARRSAGAKASLGCSLVGAFGCSLESNSKHVVHLGDEVKGHLVSDRLWQVVKIGFVPDREHHLAQP
jgi:hypothetical protein